MSVLQVVEKTPYEVLLINADFAARLAAYSSATLVASPAPTIIKSRYPDNVAAPELTVDGISLSPDSKVVQAKYTGGTRNTSYLVQVRARASNGLDLEVPGILKIVDVPLTQP